jgi:hypothetical protein
MRKVKVKRLVLQYDHQLGRWRCADEPVCEVAIEPEVTAEEVFEWAREAFPGSPWEFALEGFVDMWRVEKELRKQEIFA